jgi:serine/threonine protein kinase, bacterial
MPLREGQTFAGYTILKTLGVGGMGEVYLARHPRLPRPDALKILPRALSSDEFRRRFNREADLAAQLFHPHIVGIHDRGEEDGQLWISMDYVAGVDANVLMTDKYPSGMPPRQAAEIVTAVASALDYAHQRGLLHRDVKPANILISDPETTQQRIFLADFGIARNMFEASGLTAANSMIATIAYASPEQLSGRQMDGRSDQYSLACTAYDLLTGAAPFTGRDPVSIVGQHLSGAAAPIGYRRPQLAGADAVFAVAMAKDPRARYASCTDFANDLARRLEAPRAGATVLAPWPQAAPMPPPPIMPTPLPAQSNSRRTLLVVGGIVAALIIVVGAVIAFALQKDDSAVAGPSTTSSNPSSRTTSSEAPPTDSSLVLDGQPRELTGRTLCATQGSQVLMTVTAAGNDPTSAIVATLGLGDDPVVQSVGISKLDGVTYTSQGGVAHKDGDTYTISGTFNGVDLANPMTTIRKSFELVFVCP